MSTRSHNTAASIPSFWTRLKLALEDVGGSPMASLERRVRELEAEAARSAQAAEGQRGRVR